MATPTRSVLRRTLRVRLGRWPGTDGGLRRAGLAPVYDMLPMRDAPAPADDDIAGGVVEPATRFWRAVADDRRVADDVRRIANAHLTIKAVGWSR